MISLSVGPFNMNVSFLPAVLSSLLEGELPSIGMWTVCLAAGGSAVVGLFLANTDLFLTKSAQATLHHLENTDLKTTTRDGEEAKTHPKIRVLTDCS